MNGYIRYTEVGREISPVYSSLFFRGVCDILNALFLSSFKKNKNYLALAKAAAANPPYDSISIQHGGARVTTVRHYHHKVSDAAPLATARLGFASDFPAPAMAAPHVLALPFPAQGHVIPLMQLSHRLVENGIEVTFVNTELNHALVLDAMPADGTGRSLDGIHLVGVPDGLADGDDRKDLGKLVDGFSRHMPGYLEELVGRTEASGGTKISWLIADEAMGWAFEVAMKLGIRAAAFWPGSAAFLATILRIPQMIQDGIIDEKGVQLPLLFLLSCVMRISRIVSAGRVYSDWRVSNKCRVAKSAGDIPVRAGDATAPHVAAAVEQLRLAGGPTGHIPAPHPEQRGQRPRRGHRLQLVPGRGT